jgi:MFS family permease
MTTRPNTVLGVLCACVLMVVAMVAAINLAIPKLSSSDLHPSASQVVWIVDAYVLTFGCLLLPAGAFGDRHGRKGVLMAGLAIFATGCTLSALAPSVAVLLAGRAVTGLGAACVMPFTLSIAVAVHPPERRAHAIALWTAATGAGGAAGNLLGGVVLELLPWWGLFAALVPCAALLIVAVARVVPRTPRHDADLDVPGSIVLTLAFVALLDAIVEGPGLGWGSAGVLGAFAAAVALFAAFAWIERRSAHPLLDPRLFASASLRAGTLGILAAFFGLFALFFVNAQYVQEAKGFSVVGTGVAVAPLALAMIVVSRAGVGWARRLGPRRMVGGGMLLIAAGLGLLSLADAGTPYALYACFLLVVAAGMGLCAPSLSGAILSSLPPGKAGAGAGLNSAARELGSALGVAVVGTVLAARFGDGRSAAAAIGAAHDHARAVRAFTDAMDLGYRVVALVLVAAALVVIAWMRPTRAGTSARPAPADGRQPSAAG